MKIEGLPVIDVDESEEITVAVRANDLLDGLQLGRGPTHPSTNLYRLPPSCSFTVC